MQHPFRTLQFETASPLQVKQPVGALSETLAGTSTAETRGLAQKLIFCCGFVSVPDPSGLDIQGNIAKLETSSAFQNARQLVSQCLSVSVSQCLSVSVSQCLILKRYQLCGQVCQERYEAAIARTAVNCSCKTGRVRLVSSGFF